MVRTDHAKPVGLPLKGQGGTYRPCKTSWFTAEGSGWYVDHARCSSGFRAEGSGWYVQTTQDVPVGLGLKGQGGTYRPRKKFQWV